MTKRFHKMLIGVAIVGLISGHKMEAEETSWDYIYPNYYTSSIETAPFGILLGIFDGRVWMNPFNGIYFSQDLGNTWKEFGLNDKGITDIKYFDGTIYATTYYHTQTPAGLYVSNNFGNTWQHIGPEVSSEVVNVDSSSIYLGTSAHGLYVSKDLGESWEQKIYDSPIQEIQITEDNVYVDTPTKTFRSIDNGETWEEIDYIKIYPKVTYKSYTYEIQPEDIYENDMHTNLNKYAQDITIVKADKPYIFSTVNGYGVYKYEIPKYIIETNPFLDIPWEYEKNNELVDKITAYFDHEYPLLYNEPKETNTTTVNFLGIKEKPPYMYYSSHNGTDYALPYGTNIVAPYEGIASYYWCNDCGNTITIDHQNGYKTTYMHLQSDIPISKTNPTPINKGDVIGKVGLTGKTTGPHLHFMLQNTQSNKVVDPYGWQTEEYLDPWKEYITGEKSIYVWNNNLIQDSFLVSNTNPIINFDNKSLNFDSIEQPINYNINIKNYIRPTLDNTLKYINHTSVLINAYNLLGQEVVNLTNPVELSFNINNLDLSRILVNSLKIYYYNTSLKQWEPIQTIVDINNNIIKGYTNHFSQFAVMGEIDKTYYLFKDKANISSSTFTINL